MNWGELAASLMHGLADPVAIVDAAGTIRAVNPAAEQRLGRSRDDLVGQRLSSVLDGDGLEELVAAGLAGDAQRGELVVRDASGVPVHVLLRMGVAIDAGERALVCAFEQEMPRWRGPWVQIRTDESFGQIISTQGHDDRVHVGERCYRAFAGLEAPCADCPLPHMGIREEHLDVMVLPSGQLLQRKVFRTSDAIGQVMHARLSGVEVARVVAAKLDVTASRVGLSRREREVLHQLLTGLTLDHIAVVLGITERTVRFHQGNVLAKLGITSRLELVQMFLQELESEDEHAAQRRDASANVGR